MGLLELASAQVLGANAMVDLTSLGVSLEEAQCRSEEEISELYRQPQIWSKAPLILNHYTTMQGLHGIASQGIIRMSGVQFLNDSTEGEYGAELFAKMIPDLMASDRLVDEQSKYEARLFISIVLGKFNELRNKASYFVCCFCENKDQLSQWRGYGREGGFCISFSTIGLVSNINKVMPSNYHLFMPLETRETKLKKVIYRVDDQQLILRKVVNSFLNQFLELMNNYKLEGNNLLDEYNKKSNQILSDAIDSYARYTAEVVMRFLTQFKHPAFIEENEWRLVHKREIGTIEGIKFRADSNRLIPFVECEFFKELAFDSVTCGPPFSDLTKQSVELFLSSIGLANVPVKESFVPLR